MSSNNNRTSGSTSGANNRADGVAAAAAAEPTPAIPNTMISQQTTRSGLRVCKATCNTQKVVLNADVTLPQALAVVQNQAYAILHNYGYATEVVEQLLEVIRVSVDEDGVTPPENHDFQWPENIQQFVEAVETACEMQVNSSQEKIVDLLKKLEKDVIATIECIKISLKFASKAARMKFLTALIDQCDLSRQIAATVFDSEFCSKFTKLDESMKGSDGGRLESVHKDMVQAFLERIVDLITVRVCFRVDQLIGVRSDELDSAFHFVFTISATKLVLPHHDTISGDMKAVARQIDKYLEQDKDMHRLFSPVLSSALRRKSASVGDTSADKPAADNKPGKA